jgi:putative oxidoreductase
MALFSQLGNYRNTGLLVMRAGIGAMLIVHGFDKLKAGADEWTHLGNAMGNLHIHLFPVFWGFMCAVTETVGGLFCILGLWFRLVSLLLIFNFIVAALFHLDKGDGLKTASHAIELAFVFFGFFFLGPGLYSVDRK